MTSELVLFDGAEGTINGHPILNAAEVTRWFEAEGCSVDKRGALRIARLLNQYDFEGFYWRLTPKQQKQQRRTPYWVRNKRIARALATLEADLPLLIDAPTRVFPDGQRKGFTSLVKLRELVNQVRPRFKRFESRKGAATETLACHRA
jgi:hypothetical protein